jgi:PAS domain S-box-containing protein
MHDKDSILEDNNRVSEAKFRLLVQGVRDYAILMLDPDGNVASWNEGAERITGYPPDEIMGRHFSIFYPDDVRRSGHAERELQLAAADGSYQEEGWRVRRDGSLVWMHVTITAVRDDDGTLLGFSKVTKDLTERRESQEALQRLSKRYMDLYHHNPTMYFTTTPAGAIRSVNEYGAQQLGYEPEELTGRSIFELIDPRDHEWYTGHVRATTARPGSVHVLEFRKLRRDGNRIWVRENSRAVEDRDGGMSILSVCEDVTDRIRTEEELRFVAEASRTLASSLEWEPTLRTVAELAVPRIADWCAIDLVDEGELRRVAVVHADPARAELMRQYQQAYPPDPDAAIGSGAVIRTGQSAILQADEDVLRRIARDDEQLRMLRELGFRSAMIVPLIAEDRVLGAITLIASESGRVYTADDIRTAELVASRAALAVDKARLYREAQQATQARDEVLSIVSHDLRNPLNTIIMSAGFLLDFAGEADGRSDRRQLAIIKRQAEQMNRMIQDLLDVARIEAGRLAMEERREDPASLLRESCEAAQRLAESEAITVSSEAEPDLPPVCADRQRVLQVMSNLMGNAIRFTPEGGRIRLEARRDGDCVRFSVADTGTGIDADDLPHLFERFYQAQKNRRGGAGLGLSISKGIVEAHGGRIGVESEPRVGTTVFFTLPIAG